MASATITGIAQCDGGEHVTLRLTIGAQNFDFAYTMDEMLGGIPSEDRREAMLIMAKFHCSGMTKAQARTELVSPGISVVTS